jgi:hypothetical protein
VIGPGKGGCYHLQLDTFKTQIHSYKINYDTSSYNSPQNHNSASLSAANCQAHCQNVPRFWSGNKYWGGGANNMYVINKTSGDSGVGVCPIKCTKMALRATISGRIYEQ